jgi:hypothetical protein
MYASDNTGIYSTLLGPRKFFLKTPELLARKLYINNQPKNPGTCPIARLNTEARCRATTKDVNNVYEPERETP